MHCKRGCLNKESSASKTRGNQHLRVGNCLAIKQAEYPWQPVVKVDNGENRPSGAKARRFLSAIYGTAEAVPFQNLTFITGC